MQFTGTWYAAAAYKSTMVHPSSMIRVEKTADDATYTLTSRAAGYVTLL